MKELRPNYYKNKRGHDLFWKMETRGYPYQWCLGFCQINADKYERRAGHKPGADRAVDLRKAETYRRELVKLQELHRQIVQEGEIWE